MVSLQQRVACQSEKFPSEFMMTCLSAPHTVNDGVRCRWQVGMSRRVVEVRTEVSDLEPRLYVWSAVDVSQREMIERAGRSRSESPSQQRVHEEPS